MTAPHHLHSLNTMPRPTDNISRALAYALDPVLWSRDVVGWTPDPWQARLLPSVIEVMAHGTHQEHTI
jgi:hypothetical protein